MVAQLTYPGLHPLPEQSLLLCREWEGEEAVVWLKGESGEAAGVCFALKQNFYQFCFAFIFAPASRGWFCQFLKIGFLNFWRLKEAVCKANELMLGSFSCDFKILLLILILVFLIECVLPLSNLYFES